MIRPWVCQGRQKDKVFVRQSVRRAYTLTALPFYSFTPTEYQRLQVRSTCKEKKCLIIISQTKIIVSIIIILLFFFLKFLSQARDTPSIFFLRRQLGKQPLLKNKRFIKFIKFTVTFHFSIMFFFRKSKLFILISFIIFILKILYFFAFKFLLLSFLMRGEYLYFGFTKKASKGKKKYAAFPFPVVSYAQPVSLEKKRAYFLRSLLFTVFF